MKLSRPHYKEWLEPRLAEAELADAWRQVSQRLEVDRRPGPSRRVWFIAAAAAAVVLAAGALSLRREPALQLAGQTVNAPERASHTLQLPDGSAVELHANAKLRVQRFEPALVRLELLAGEATFDVAHREGRAFEVTAGGFEVVVVGTRFTVGVPFAGASPPGEVQVAVERGRVRVVRAGGQGEVVLQASERWSSAPAQAGVAVGSAWLDGGGEAQATTADASASASPLSIEPPPERATQTPVVAPGGAESAAGLFDAANRSRVAGQPAEAARLFDKLRREHRRDRRAALSALELGRVRLDALGDPAGAAAALEDALRLGLSGSLRDDALGRRVEAYERSGNVSACQRTREAYLASLPRGTHRAVVSRRCAGE